MTTRKQMEAKICNNCKYYDLNNSKDLTAYCNLSPVKTERFMNDTACDKFQCIVDDSKIHTAGDIEDYIKDTFHEVPMYDSCNPDRRYTDVRMGNAKVYIKYNEN